MVGKYFKPDMRVIKTLPPQTQSIIKTMLKCGGLMVVSVDGDFVEVAANPMDAFLGTVRLPITALLTGELL